MNVALSEALEGMTTFDENSISVELIAKIMICYLTESIFLQIAHLMLARHGIKPTILFKFPMLKMI